MFGANDFFDKDKIKVPYKDIRENLEDYSHLVDLILENAIENLMNSSGCIYRPGIVMKEAEVEEFYGVPPLSRSRKAYDPEFAGHLNEALLHIKSREKATKKKALLPFARLRQEFELTFFEELALLLPLGLSMNINLRNFYAFIANDATLKYPTCGVLFSIYQMIDEEADLGLLEDLTDGMGKMSVNFFMPFEINQGKNSLMELPLRLRSDVRHFLLSGNLPVDMTSYGLESIKGEEGLFVFGGELSLDVDDGGFIYVASNDPDDVPQFLFERGNSKARIINGDLLISDIKNLKTLNSRTAMAHALGALFFRLRLSKETLCIKLSDPYAQMWDILFDVVKRFLGGRTVFVYGADNMPTQFLSLSYDISCIKLPIPDVEIRENIWKHFLDKEKLALSEDINISDLADCYELSFSKISFVVRETARKTRWQGKETIEEFELKEQLRHLGEASLFNLAVYIPPVYSMDDLQIDELQKKILITACNRFKIRNRVEKKYGIRRSGAYGNGVSVLLCGPPGTGKTMAAQVISKELSLPLYRVDLSRVISKYIGETQKNLSEIFDHAKKTNAILFFDEADALFAKRTEVNDSNDKYANAETAFLLQKVEGHSGMTILATNLMANFDQAFSRRLSYIVRLQKPDYETKLSLWKSILPGDVRLEENVDFEFFAETFDFSGSQIKSILYDAMYMATYEDRPVGNGDIVRSIRLRSEKLGSINDPGEFGKYAGFLF